MAIDYSQDPRMSLDAMEFKDLSGVWKEILASTSETAIALKNINGFICVGAGTSGQDVGPLLLSKDGSLNPVWVGGTGTNGPGYYGMCAAVQDVLISNHYASGTMYGMNLREDGVERLINNSAALSGFRPLSTSVTEGWVALNGSTNTATKEPEHYADERFLIGVSASNTTYYGTGSAVADPTTAPTCTPSATDGTLAAGDYDVAYAWVTRRNMRATGQGITTPSSTQEDITVGGATTGSITVDIPVPPTGVTAYVVYAAEANGTLRVVGGGIALAAGTTHVIKETMAGLNMASRLFIRTDSTIRQAVVGTIENANPITHGTSRTLTSQFTGILWSPFFRDTTQVNFLSAQGQGVRKADKLDIIADTIALNQTVTADGAPCVYGASGGWTGQFVQYRSIPELMAYAVIFTPSSSAGASAGLTFVQIRSCMTNEILTTIVAPNVTAYTQGQTVSASNYAVGTYDFIEEYEDAGNATKAVSLLIPSRRDRGIWKRRIGWFS